MESVYQVLDNMEEEKAKKYRMALQRWEECFGSFDSFLSAFLSLHMPLSRFSSPCLCLLSFVFCLLSFVFVFVFVFVFAWYHLCDCLCLFIFVSLSLSLSSLPSLVPLLSLFQT